MLTVQIMTYRTLRGLGLYNSDIFNSLSDIYIIGEISIPFASLIQVLAGWMIKGFFQNRNSARLGEAVSVAKKRHLPFPRILQRERRGKQREEQGYLNHWEVSR